MLLALAAAFVSVTVAPGRPYLEPAGRMVHLNCDFVLRNQGTSIATLPVREVPPNDFIVVFNPFEAWEPDVLPNRMRYRFTLKLPKETAAPDAPAVEAEVTFTPQAWSGRARLITPLRGRFLVWDGHDLYSHHRRWDVSHPILKGMGIRNNPGRYAYDLSVVDGKGEMYRGTGRQPEDWYGIGVPVLAPAANRVVAAVHTAPRPRSGERDGEAG